MSSGGREELPEPVELVIRCDRDSGAFVLALYGDLDMVSAPTLERQLTLVASERPARVVIDLSGLDFLDSSGLETLLSGQDRLGEAGVELLLLRGARAVHRVFEVTNTLNLFSFED